MQSELQTPEQRQEIYDQIGLSRLAPIIEQHMKPSVRIRTSPSTDSEIPIGTSKFGGLPDLPPNIPWPWWAGDPKDHEEMEAYHAQDDWHDYAYLPNPLLFMAQINLAEIAHYDVDDALPKQGMLYFFAAVWLDAVGDRPAGDSNCKVIYFDGDISTLVRTGLPENAPEYMQFLNRNAVIPETHIYPECTATFSYQATPLNWDAYEFQDQILDISEDESQALEKLDNLLELDVDIREPIHLILGNPQRTQRDIRGECAIGLPGDEEEEAVKWRLLLQLSSDPPNNMTWQAWGHGYFMIECDAFAQGNFDNIKLVHHCG